MSQVPALSLRQLGVTYADGNCALSDVDVEIARGDFVVVVGTSGAGKSTLLRAINGLTPLTHGQVRIHGTALPSRPGRALRQLRTRIGMIFQDGRLSPRLPVMSNVLVGRLGHVPAWRAVLNLWPQHDRRIALQALERVGIANKAWARADTLSGGQQQRVGIARALAQEPSLLLADEPVASLDPITSRQIMNDLERINTQLGITVVVNLHDIELARRYGHRILGLSQGKLVFDGPPAALDNDQLGRIYGSMASPDRSTGDEPTA